MKRILAYPQVYNLYQNMIGVDKFYSVFVKNIILSEKVENILDLACGTARMLKFLDANVGYTGVDISERYIKYNQKNAVNLKHKFFIADICEFANFGNDFDTIVSEGVMVAFSNAELEKMFRNIVVNSHKNTRIILSDLNYKDAISPVEKFFQNNQRYKNFRTKEDYINFIEQFFSIKKVIELENVYRIPYSKVIFECSIKN